MSSSPQAQQFARFLESVRAKSSTPGLDLGIVRDIVETHHLASTEPEGITYAEVDADGVPAMWCIPEGADPTGRCCTSTSVARSPRPCTPTARPPATSPRPPEPARSSWTSA